MFDFLIFGSVTLTSRGGFGATLPKAAVAVRFLPFLSSLTSTFITSLVLLLVMSVFPPSDYSSFVGQRIVSISPVDAPCGSLTIQEDGYFDSSI